MKDTNNKIKHWIAMAAWRLYVKLWWSENISVQKKLTDSVGQNLGYYLKFSHPDFK